MHSATFKKFLQLLWRDFYVFRTRITSLGINYCIIFPILTISISGYVQPGVFFGPGHSKLSIVLLIGMFSLNILSLCFTLLSPFIYDLEADRFIDYQLLLLPPKLLVFEMIVFTALITNLISLPFFPLARLLLPMYFETLSPSWPALLIIVFCTCLCCAAYIMAALCIIKKSYNVRQFWLRCNWPLLVLGGFWIPWVTLKKYSVCIATISLLNPFTYITEGLRSSLIGSDQFIPYQLCIFALLTFFCIFTLVALFFFKRKLDHV